MDGVSCDEGKRFYELDRIRASNDRTEHARLPLAADSEGVNGRVTPGHDDRKIGNRLIAISGWAKLHPHA
jgi:hypothetical protein